MPAAPTRQWAVKMLFANLVAMLIGVARGNPARPRKGRAEYTKVRSALDAAADRAPAVGDLYNIPSGYAGDGDFLWLVAAEHEDGSGRLLVVPADNYVELCGVVDVAGDSYAVGTDSTMVARIGGAVWVRPALLTAENRIDQDLVFWAKLARQSVARDAARGEFLLLAAHEQTAYDFNYAGWRQEVLDAKKAVEEANAVCEAAEKETPCAG